MSSCILTMSLSSVMFTTIPVKANDTQNLREDCVIFGECGSDTINLLDNIAQGKNEGYEYKDNTDYECYKYNRTSLDFEEGRFNNIYCVKFKSGNLIDLFRIGQNEEFLSRFSSMVFALNAENYKNSIKCGRFSNYLDEIDDFFEHKVKIKIIVNHHNDTNSDDKYANINSGFLSGKYKNLEIDHDIPVITPGYEYGSIFAYPITHYYGYGNCKNYYTDGHIDFWSITGLSQEPSPIDCSQIDYDTDNDKPVAPSTNRLYSCMQNHPVVSGIGTLGAIALISGVIYKVVNPSLTKTFKNSNNSKVDISTLDKIKKSSNCKQLKNQSKN